MRKILTLLLVLNCLYGGSATSVRRRSLPKDVAKQLDMAEKGQVPCYDLTEVVVQKDGEFQSDLLDALEAGFTQESVESLANDGLNLELSILVFGLIGLIFGIAVHMRPA